MKIRVETVLPVTPQTFWSSLFFNLDYNVGLHKQLGFLHYEVRSESVRDDGCIERVLYTEPPMNAPEVVARRLGRAFSVTEHGSFDPRSEVYSFTHTPTVASGSTRIEGTIRVQPHAQGLLHVVDALVEVSAFGLGGLLERAIESGIRESYRNSAGYTLAYAEARGLRYVAT